MNDVNLPVKAKDKKKKSETKNCYVIDPRRTRVLVDTRNGDEPQISLCIAQQMNAKPLGKCTNKMLIKTVRPEFIQHGDLWLTKYKVCFLRQLCTLCLSALVVCPTRYKTYMYVYEQNVHTKAND